MTNPKQNNHYVTYGKVLTATSSHIIELEVINGKCEISLEIPLTFKMENILFGKNDLQ